MRHFASFATPQLPVNSSIRPDPLSPPLSPLFTNIIYRTEIKHRAREAKQQLALKVVLEPSGQECRVSAAIRYGASKSDTTDPTSVGPMPLFEGRQAKQEAAR